MPKTDEKDGVWRTIGGRRVFIKDGQSVSDAMKESGKFKSASKTKTDTSNNVKKERTYEDVDKEWKEQASKMEKNYDEFGSNTVEDEKKLNELSAERDRLSIHRDDSKVDVPGFEGYEYDKKTGEVKVKDYDKRLSEVQKNEYTRQELKDKFGTDDVDLINAGKEKENRVSLKEGNPIENMANDRVKEKQNSLQMNKMLLENMNKNNIDKLPDGTTKDDLEFSIWENQNYIDTANNNFENLKKNRISEDEKEKYMKDNNLTTFTSRDEYNYLKNKANKSTNDTMNDAIRVKASRSSLYKSKPESKEIESQGTSNRKEVSNNIQAHILDYYDSPKDFIEQMEAMGTSNMWRAGEEIARGGGYLIYNGDMADFLDDLKINPKGKKFSEDKSFDMYTSLIGRESARLYDKLKKEESKGRSFNDSLRRKAYEKYLKEHPSSKIKFNEFVKNNEK